MRPFKGLLFGILERAILDYCGSAFIATKDVKEDAKEWIFDYNLIEPFTFIWCCEHLGLDYIEIRKNIALLDKIRAPLGRTTLDSVNRRLNFQYETGTGAEIYIC